MRLGFLYPLYNLQLQRCRPMNITRSIEKLNILFVQTSPLMRQQFRGKKQRERIDMLKPIEINTLEDGFGHTRRL